MAHETRLIKKHANRRFYDNQEKKYLSIDAIRRIICDGVDVRVEDSKTGDDITSAVLLQIMVEFEQGDRPMLSPSMLMSLIRHYGHPMQDFVGPFLENSLGFYFRQEARIRKRLSDLAPSGEKFGQGGDSIPSMREFFARMMGPDQND